MRRLLVALALALVACTTPTDGPTVYPTNPTTTTVVPSGIPVDETAIPDPIEGIDRHWIEPARYSPTPSTDGVASFRVNCVLSHMNFDDPIVYPGAQRATHLHHYFGHVGADYRTTPMSVYSGNSTCSGGTANRTAYWAPAIIDTNTGAPIVSHDPNNIYVALNALQVYYKSGYYGVNPTTIQNFPVGLRMVAGDARATSPQSTRIVQFSCGGAGYSHMPNCQPGQTLVMSIIFPQCWDGVNLDSPDHKSHMAYANGGCPASHPVPLPEVTQNYRFLVPPSGMGSWRLASDMYDGPAGYSAHADWMNGWDEAVFQRVLDNCYRRVLDCQMNLLGDGQALGFYG